MSAASVKGARLHSGGIHAGGVQRVCHSVTARGGSSKSESCLEL